MFVKTDNAPPRTFHEAKAGQIKVAYTTDGLNTHFTRLFAAAAAACNATGAPMMIHIDNGMDPLVLDDFLDKCDVLPQKRIYCHLDRAVADMSIHLELCKRGCWLEYDTIGRPKYHDDAAEIAIIQQMLDGGYGANILLGLDTTGKRLKAYGGVIGLDYIVRTFIPAMSAAGIGRDVVDAFMVDNPARVFAF
jgi:phosphotriesterase-related protein